MNELQQGYIIYGWMGDKDMLNLKGYKKEVYALIYSFSRDGVNKYYGSLNYLMNVIGVSKPTIISSIDYLIDKGFIIKETSNNSTETNKYFANMEVVKNLYQGGKKSLPEVVKNFNEGGKKSLPNKYNNKNNNNNTNQELLFGKPKNTKRLFENSYYNDYENVKNYLLAKGYKDKFRGADLKYYIEKVKTWSDTSNKKTTDRGWIAYIRQFMDSDINKGSFVTLKSKVKDDLTSKLKNKQHVNY